MSNIVIPDKKIVTPSDENIKRRVLFESKGGEKGEVSSKGRSYYGGGGIKGTRIVVKNLDTGEEQVRTNKVVVSGAQFTASKQWGLPYIIDFPSYNKSMNLDNSVYKEKENDNVICLFCMGTAGCGAELSQVYDVQYTKRIQPENMIPFRYQIVTNDLSEDQRKVYYGRRETNDRIAYYFKKPETDPEMHGRYIDGTNLDENIFDSLNTMEAEFYVETMLKVDKADFRDYFIATTGINTALVNQVSLLQAWYTTDSNGIKWYQDVLPVTQLNFSNESLIDLTKGIEIIYQVFY